MSMPIRDKSLQHTSICTRRALPNNGSEFFQRKTSCLVPSNLLVTLLLSSNWQCGHTRVCSQLGAGTPQETHHYLGGCEFCVLWIVSRDDLQQHSPHPFCP